MPSATKSDMALMGGVGSGRHFDRSAKGKAKSSDANGARCSCTVFMTKASFCSKFQSLQSSAKGYFPRSGHAGLPIPDCALRRGAGTCKWKRGAAPSGTVAFEAQRLLTKPKLALRPGHGLRGDLMHVAAFVNGIAPLIGIDHLLGNRLLANGAADGGG